MSSADTYARHANKVTNLVARLTPYKVTWAEVVFALSFVVNFIVGKLIHVFSQEEEVYNYYNNKGNIFNQWFVKKGWAWTTLVVVAFYAVHLVNAPRNIRAKIAATAFFRWTFATFWWVLFTQWCFGVPIMDKVFIVTGGKCAQIPPTTVSALLNSDGAVNGNFYLNGDAYESTAISSYSCRKLKGSWEGGLDPLGHVFLLVHASLYMFHEIKEFWPGWAQFLHQARALGHTKKHSLRIRLQRLVGNSPHVPVLLLLCLWWFMLLVTNMYFHSLAEKFMGLAFGYLGILAVYYAPRYVARGKIPLKER